MKACGLLDRGHKSYGLEQGLTRRIISSWHGENMGKWRIWGNNDRAIDKLITIKNHVFLCKADQKNKKESINILTSSMITPFVSICSKSASFLADHPARKIDDQGGTKKHVHLCVEM